MGFKTGFLTKTSYMSDFNTKLQGSNQLIYKLYQYINAFDRKLKLLEIKYREKRFT